MSKADIDALEAELQAEIRPSGNTCAFCAYLAAQPLDQRRWWDAKLWDGEVDGELVQNTAFNTQAIQRMVLKRVPKSKDGSPDFPNTSVENHRKHGHRTPLDV